jgi:hypothetical protein
MRRILLSLLMGAFILGGVTFAATHTVFVENGSRTT